jgi:hypothetical protein
MQSRQAKKLKEAKKSFSALGVVITLNNPLRWYHRPSMIFGVFGCSCYFDSKVAFVQR